MYEMSLTSVLTSHTAWELIPLDGENEFLPGTLVRRTGWAGSLGTVIGTEGVDLTGISIPFYRVLWGSLGDGSERIRIGSSGNVGIGTVSSPAGLRI